MLFRRSGCRFVSCSSMGFGGEFEDIHRRLEAVLQGVSEGMGSCIQDKGVLEHCVGLPMEWQTVARRAAVVSVSMTGRLSLGPEGPLAGGAPPPERGSSGDSLEVP
jgi:hypothetical protein